MPDSKKDRAAELDNYARGMLLYRRGQHEEAAALLGELNGRKDLIGRLAQYYEAMAHRAMGIEALRSGQFGLAEKHLCLAVQALGRDAELSAYLAAVYAKTNRHEQCAAQMERAANIQADNSQAWLGLAQAQWRAGRRIDAYATLNRAVRRLGDQAPLHLQLGLFYAAEQRFAEAQASLSVAVQADPSNSEAHTCLGLAAAAQGQSGQAVRSLQRAMELRPNDVLLAYELALAARAAGEGRYHVAVHLPDPARTTPGENEIRQLARFVMGEPEFLEAFLELPESQADPELFELLTGVIRTALAERPGYADLHFYCARVFKRLGRIEQAIEQAQQAVASNPRYLRALLLLGELHAQSGSPAEALDCFCQAIDAGADWPDVHCLAGELMARCNQTQAARRHLRRALELKADYPRAAGALAALAA